MSSDNVINVKNVSKRFCRSLKRSLFYGAIDSTMEFLPMREDRERKLRTAEFWANRGISFELERGQSLGLIGENGAGKTTLLKMLNGLIKPDTGEIRIRGRVGALIALGAGFNPILTGRENVYANGAILGMSRSEIRKRMDEIVDFADIRDSIDAPVQNYSSGMQVRLGFAVAATTNPEILLVDEVLAVGDAAFRRKCYSYIRTLRNQGTAVVLVSHNIAQIASNCDRGVYLKGGEQVSHGEIAKVIEDYQNDYNSNVAIPARARESREEIFIKDLESDGQLVSGDDFRFRISVESEIEIDEAWVDISMLDDEQSLELIRFSTRSTGDRVSITRGTNEFRVSSDQLNVKSGTYYLKASVGEIGSINAACEVGFSSDPVPVVVRDPHLRVPIMLKGAKVPFYFDHRWEKVS